MSNLFETHQSKIRPNIIFLDENFLHKNKPKRNEQNINLNKKLQFRFIDLLT